MLLVVAAVAGRRLEPDFGRYFGSVPAVVVVAAALGTGWCALQILDRMDWFPADRVPTGRWMVIAIVGAFVLACVAVVGDIALGFDEDINVRWPGSLAFYAVISVVAEVVFHLVPLALAAVAVPNPRTDFRGRVVVALLVVAALEACFQVVLSRANADAGLLTGFVGVHLFAIGLFQMALFWRAGPVAMLAFRPVYYVLWHVAWGVLRLRLSF